MKLYCHTKYTISIAYILAQHDQMKCIDIFIHFMKGLDSGLICAPYVSTINL